MRFLSTSLIVSLLAFSISTHARENTVFGGVTYLDTETIGTETSDDDQGGTDAVVTVTTGSRSGFGFYFQSFEDESLYVGAGFQRTEGDYNVCVLEDCGDVGLTVNEVNLELGWSMRQWTPFVDFVSSDTEADDPDLSDTDTDWDLGFGFWYQPSEETKLKFNISGLRDSDNQILTSGFQRILQNDITISGAFMYPLAQDVTGNGFRFAIGWTL